MVWETAQHTHTASRLKEKQLNERCILHKKTIFISKNTVAYSARSFLSHGKKKKRKKSHIFRLPKKVGGRRGGTGDPHGFWSLNIKVLYQQVCSVVSNTMLHISSVPRPPCHTLPSASGMPPPLAS